MKFLFNKIICLSVSVAWVSLASAQSELERKEILSQAEKAIYKVQVTDSYNNEYNHWGIATGIDIEVGIGAGTGFFISTNLFVTALHNIESAKQVHQISLHSSAGRRSRSIKVRRIEFASAYLDLVILRTQTRSPYFLKQGEIPLSETLTLMGYPQGRFIRLESKGFVAPSIEPFSPFYRVQFKNEESLKFQGASGSPLLNSKGEFVGVVLQVEAGGTRKVLLFIPSESINDLLNEERGQKCSGYFACVEKEYGLAQEHIETYANNTEEIPLDEETFFHLPPSFIIYMSDINTALSYLARGAEQEQDLFKPVMLLLFYLKHTQSIDRNIYRDWVHLVGEQGNGIVQEWLFEKYLTGTGGFEKNNEQAIYWFQKLVHPKFNQELIERANEFIRSIE